MAEDLGEKTEEPTIKRRDEAREQGQIARSQDLSAATAAVAIVTAMFLFTDAMIVSATDILRYSLGENVLGVTTLDRLKLDLRIGGWQLVRMVGPIMALMAVAALATGVVQVGWKLSPEALKPRLDRLNLVKGVKKIIGKRAIVKALLDVLKLVVIGAAALAIINDGYGQVVALSGVPLKQGVVVGAELALRTALWVLLILVLLGLIDLRYQRWQMTEDLKMTKHEVKDERKSTEGDMDVKRRRLQQARQIAMQRIAIDVPKADVVVTNPTHYSIAIQYQPDDGVAAPKVVAKGADYLAMKIRYIALAHGIPLVERAPLARALYREVKIGQEIHPAHYEAVAEVLAYVYRLDRSLAS